MKRDSDNLVLHDPKGLSTAQLKFDIFALEVDLDGYRFVVDDPAGVLEDEELDEEDEAEIADFRRCIEKIEQYLVVAKAELKTRPDKDTAQLEIETKEI